MSVTLLPVLLVNLSQRSNVRLLSCRSPFRSRGQLTRLVKGGAAAFHVAVVPQAVVVRHRNSPVCHGAIGIFGADLSKGLVGLLVLEGMQQSDGTGKVGGHGFRAGCVEVNRANLFVG